MIDIRPERRAPVPLARVAAVAGATGPTADAAAVTVTGVGLDSRTIRPGDLYAALPGANVHGGRFVDGAVERGAVAVLTDSAGAALAAGTPVPVLIVADPRAALGQVAAEIYGTRPPGLDLIGVTGTNGKTTTAYLIDSALRALGRRTGLIGTVETRIGDQRVKSVRTTPEATDLHALLAAMREADVATCVMEVSSHALAMHRVDGVVYDVALFTNLSQDHLDYHGTMEDYFLAKAELFTPERATRGVVCVDDAWGARLAGMATIPVSTVSSTGAPADWRLDAAPDGAEFTLTGPHTQLALRSALPGDFNRVNTALATLALLALGHDAGAVREAVLTDPHVPGRMEKVAPAAGSDAPLAVVDYAHTPEAVAAALAALRPQAVPGGLVVVLGAGGDRDRGKRAAMGAAAAREADIVIVTDDNPRSEDPAVIRAAVVAGARESAPHKDIREIADRAEAIAAAVAAAVAAGRGAVVAVVGKGHETGQEIGGVVHPFDDREQVRAALDAAYGQAS
ncbi:UDP-N-acetylmuramoyl-L-alanyl-D-glutamate--2,6-diaminopimelate ligase [Nostocoides australiense]|nr:UDP-N-acetylmuramoyl-L-alanyl-D-glutamate--2,6-diaminopimelate ligase [Tetrasphaera australiensis]